MWPKVLPHVKKFLYNQPKPYFFKKLLWSHFWIDFNKFYTRVGLTRDTYAFSLIDLLEMFMFLLRKLMVLLALEQMVLICLPHLRSDEMVHPRYFADVSCSRICPCSVQLYLDGLRFLEMVSTLHFSGWNFMSLFNSHSASLSRFCWRFAASASDDIVTYAMVSSSNSRTIDWIPSGMSFI